MEESIRIHGNVSTQDDVYYKHLRMDNDLITVVCLQWIDEHDYDQSRFLRDSDSVVHVFETEKMAIDKLNEWFAPYVIDPEYLRYDITQDEKAKDEHGYSLAVENRYIETWSDMMGSRGYYEPDVKITKSEGMIYWYTDVKRWINSYSYPRELVDLDRLTSMLADCKTMLDEQKKMADAE